MKNTEAYTVDEFCKAYRISRAKLYQLWAADKGPRVKRHGKWVIITVDDAKKWAATDEQSPPRAAGLADAG